MSPQLLEKRPRAVLPRKDSRRGRHHCHDRRFPHPRLPARHLATTATDYLRARPHLRRALRPPRRQTRHRRRPPPLHGRGPHRRLRRPQLRLARPRPLPSHQRLHPRIRGGQRRTPHPLLPLRPRRRRQRRDRALRRASAPAASASCDPKARATTSTTSDGPADLLADTRRQHDLMLLFHATEPVGRDYPGKEGRPLDPLYRFIERSPKVTVVAAHWGGGLPFYNLLRSTGHAFANTYFDTAATRYLYRPEVFRHAVDLVGAEHVLFGSDFPLLSQSRCVEEVEEARTRRQGETTGAGRKRPPPAGAAMKESRGRRPQSKTRPPRAGSTPCASSSPASSHKTRRTP